MDDHEIWTHVSEHRRRLVEVLAGLSADQWERPSLCAAWRVRDVAAHLTDADARLVDVIGPLLRARFDIDRMIREHALANLASPAELVERLRGMVDSRRPAIGVTPQETLLDALVHSQDITVPLGIELPIDPTAAAASAQRVLTMPRRLRMWRPPADVELVATDTDWRYGSGPAVTGTMRWLLLALTGRPGALEHLQGDTSLLDAV